MMKLCRASSVDCRLRRYCCVTSRALLAPDVTCSRTVRIIEALHLEEDAMVRTRGMCLPQQSCVHAFAAMAFLDAIRPGYSALGPSTGWPWMGLPLEPLLEAVARTSIALLASTAIYHIHPWLLHQI